jgi:hypothetical protein
MIRRLTEGRNCGSVGVGQVVLKYKGGRRVVVQQERRRKLTSEVNYRCLK